MPVAATTELKLRKNGALKYELLLLMVSIIWGSTFVAQQIGMEKGLGPMTFNGLRFGLGCLVLIPVIIWRTKTTGHARMEGKLPYTGSVAAGVFLFAAASFQQIGLQYTSSTNSGFITGFYILFVPLIGMFFGHRAPSRLWGAILVCLVGFYLLSVSEDFVVSKGDLLTLICAMLWACQILVIDHVVDKGDPIQIAFLQVAICAVLSSASGLLFGAARSIRSWRPRAPLRTPGSCPSESPLRCRWSARKDVPRTGRHPHESGSGLRRDGRIPHSQSNAYRSSGGRLRPDSLRSPDRAVGADAGTIGKDNRKARIHEERHELEPPSVSPHHRPGGHGAGGRLDVRPGGSLGRPPGKTIGVGCIGLGTRGGDLINAVVHAPNVKVAAVCDVYGPHRQKGIERSLNPEVKAYVDYRELLADPNVDAVVIATPDHWHCQMVLDAVKAGKDIYCEKGFSRTLAEAKLMRDALKQSRVVFQLGHHARQATCALQAKELIAQDILGPITLVRTGRFKSTEPEHPNWRWYGYYDQWDRPDPAQVVEGSELGSLAGAGAEDSLERTPLLALALLLGLRHRLCRRPAVARDGLRAIPPRPRHPGHLHLRRPDRAAPGRSRGAGHLGPRPTSSRSSAGRSPSPGA